MSYKIFLGTQNPPDSSWVHLRSFLDFKVAVTARGTPDEVAFDYNLEGDGNGFDAAAWLINHCVVFSILFPKYSVMCKNPAHHEKIEMLIRSFNLYRQSTIK